MKEEKCFELVRVCRLTPKGRQELEKLLDLYAKSQSIKDRFEDIEEFICQTLNKAYRQGIKDSKLDRLSKHMKDT